MGALDTPETLKYIAAVKRRGGHFVRALPANTNLGPGALGRPGGWVPKVGIEPSRYEYAPWVVQMELSTNGAIQSLDELVTRTANGAHDALGEVADATGISRGIFGAAAKLLGIPVGVVVPLVVFLGYATLAGAGLVPPLRKVFK